MFKKTCTKQGQHSGNPNPKGSVFHENMGEGVKSVKIGKLKYGGLQINPDTKQIRWGANGCAWEWDKKWNMG